MEFSLRVGDMSVFVFCKFEIVIFKIVQIMTENIPFAFLYVLSLCCVQIPNHRNMSIAVYRKIKQAFHYCILTKDFTVNCKSFQTRIREPAFNTLRTKHQLGYSVHTKNYDTCGVMGLGIVIEYQANKFRYIVTSGKHVRAINPLKPHFYIVKLGVCRGIPTCISLIFAPKHRLWVLVRTASARRF